MSQQGDEGAAELEAGNDEPAEELPRALTYFKDTVKRAMQDVSIPEDARALAPGAGWCRQWNRLDREGVYQCERRDGRLCTKYPCVLIRALHPWVLDVHRQAVDHSDVAAM